jgi:hypothetical protein
MRFDRPKLLIAIAKIRGGKTKTFSNRYKVTPDWQLAKKIMGLSKNRPIMHTPKGGCPGVARQL